MSVEYEYYQLRYDCFFCFLRPMETNATRTNNSQHCWVLLTNNVASVCMGRKVWPVSQQVPQVPILLWIHANGRNKSQHCWAQQCWVLLANNVGSLCMGLYVQRYSLVYSVKEWRPDLLQSVTCITKCDDYYKMCLNNMLSMLSSCGSWICERCSFKISVKYLFIGAFLTLIGQRANFIQWIGIYPLGKVIHSSYNRTQFIQ